MSELNKKIEKNKSDNGKKGDKNEKKSAYVDKLKDEYNIDIEEYLKTDAEDMQFDDALKYEKKHFVNISVKNAKKIKLLWILFSIMKN